MIPIVTDQPLTLGCTALDAVTLADALVVGSVLCLLEKQVLFPLKDMFYVFVQRFSLVDLMFSFTTTDASLWRFRFQHFFLHFLVPISVVCR